MFGIKTLSAWEKQEQAEHGKKCNTDPRWLTDLSEDSCSKLGRVVVLNPINYLKRNFSSYVTRTYEYFLREVSVFVRWHVLSVVAFVYSVCEPTRAYWKIDFCSSLEGVVVLNSWFLTGANTTELIFTRWVFVMKQKVKTFKEFDGFSETLQNLSRQQTKKEQT